VVWTPWQQMNVDIPNYTVEIPPAAASSSSSSGGTSSSGGSGDTGNLGSASGTAPTAGTGPSGTYLTPLVYYGRLMVFFLQLVQKTLTNPQGTATSGTSTSGTASNSAPGSFAALGNSGSNGPSSQTPIQYWDVTLCYSEYRNGRWTPKQMAKDPVTGAIPTMGGPLPPADSFQVIPRFSNILVAGSTTLWETQIYFDIYRCVPSSSTLTFIGASLHHPHPPHQLHTSWLLAHTFTPTVV
jgi:hypothetical protein